MAGTMANPGAQRAQKIASKRAVKAQPTGKRQGGRKILPAASSGDEQPLDLGRLVTHAGYRLRRAQISVFDDFIRTAQGAQLRPAQFSTLVVIDANPGSKQADVAHALGIKSTNFVALANELERRGLIERRASDRRSHALHLTGKGKATLEAVINLQDAVEKKYDAVLGKGGREKLFAMLDKLCDGKA